MAGKLVVMMTTSTGTVKAGQSRNGLKGADGFMHWQAPGICHHHNTRAEKTRTNEALFALGFKGGGDVEPEDPSAHSARLYTHACGWAIRAEYFPRGKSTYERLS